MSVWVTLLIGVGMADGMVAFQKRNQCTMTGRNWFLTPVVSPVVFALFPPLPQELSPFFDGFQPRLGNIDDIR